MNILKTEADYINILLVEDNPADVYLTKESIKDSEIPHNFYSVGDGDEAMAYLRRANGYVDAVSPDIIMLDLNLPKKTGFEVLAEIKQDPDLSRIPVIILTTSTIEQDVEKAYNLSAGYYMFKPLDPEQFSTVINMLKDAGSL